MFVEEGEECDCGLPEHCDNPCCDPSTCKLHVNATCAVGECCDTAVRNRNFAPFFRDLKLFPNFSLCFPSSSTFQTCRVKNAGVMCRSALQECDLPEYCTGTSEYCPTDLYKMDGLSCGQEKVTPSNYEFVDLPFWCSYMTLGIDLCRLIATKAPAGATRTNVACYGDRRAKGPTPSATNKTPTAIKRATADITSQMILLQNAVMSKFCVD